MGDALSVILSQLYHSKDKTSKQLLVPDFEKGQESWGKKRTFPSISLASWKEAKRVPRDKTTVSPHWLTVLPSSAASQGRCNL